MNASGGRDLDTANLSPEPRGENDRALRKDRTPGARTKNSTGEERHQKNSLRGQTLSACYRLLMQQWRPATGVVRMATCKCKA